MARMKPDMFTRVRAPMQPSEYVDNSAQSPFSEEPEKQISSHAVWVSEKWKEVLANCKNSTTKEK